MSPCPHCGTEATPTRAMALRDEAGGVGLVDLYREPKVEGQP